MNLSPLIISLKISLVSLVFTVVIGILISYKMFFYKGKLKSIFDCLLNLPLVLPPTVAGFFLLVLFGRKGPFGILLNNFGVNLIFSWQAGILATFIVTLPFMYRSVSLSLHHIDKSLFECSHVFGATKLQTFIYIALPLSWQGILTGAMLSFLRSLGEFGATLMVAGSIPGKTQTIPSAIYSLASNGEYSKALFWIITLISISFIFMLVVNKLGKDNF